MKRCWLKMGDPHETSGVSGVAPWVADLALSIVSEMIVGILLRDNLSEAPCEKLSSGSSRVFDYYFFFTVHLCDLGGEKLTNCA